MPLAPFFQAHEIAIYIDGLWIYTKVQNKQLQ